mmetsp:Transcript_329/g.753  ORF Transcript_329/g.753 Transcript_329/m.753 type:complete len:249 (+) Transcript_329:57-803(+)
MVPSTRVFNCSLLVVGENVLVPLLGSSLCFFSFEGSEGFLLLHVVHDARHGPPSCDHAHRREREVGAVALGHGRARGRRRRHGRPRRGDGLEHELSLLPDASSSGGAQAASGGRLGLCGRALGHVVRPADLPVGHARGKRARSDAHLPRGSRLARARAGTAVARNEHFLFSSPWSCSTRRWARSNVLFFFFFFTTEKSRPAVLVDTGNASFVRRAPFLPQSIETATRALRFFSPRALSSAAPPVGGKE